MKKQRKVKPAKYVELAELFKRKHEIEGKSAEELTKALIVEYRQLLRRLTDMI